PHAPPAPHARRPLRTRSPRASRCGGLLAAFPAEPASGAAPPPPTRGGAPFPQRPEREGAALETASPVWRAALCVWSPRCPLSLTLVHCAASGRGAPPSGALRGVEEQVPPAAGAVRRFTCFRGTWVERPRARAGRRRALESVLLEISRILNTGLDMETLSICVRLCEQGINPEALSSVIKELRKATEALKAAENTTS
ncbi:mitotic-spindle organizing protein 1, partial [Canis lupus dingo]|uniref:mitotic-spindle organizing protein 1 n=1 Tax=Canis lupus dingo TaxID=286419 RepID=UPI0020C39A91